MTFLARLREAAFWEDAVCLACGETCESEESPPYVTCGECGGHSVASARAVLAAVEQAMRDGEGESP